jgi:ABC-type phosphate transport system substrate-binding protein
MRARVHLLATALLAVLCVCSALSLAAGGVTVVAHVDTPLLNEDTLQRVYLGKIVEVNGRPIIPVNLTKGSTLRKAFMEQVLTQDDEKFIAYWTVRRYIGKGTPPLEFATIEQQLQFVRSTPGAVGYVDETADIRQGLRTLLRKP